MDDYFSTHQESFTPRTTDIIGRQKYKDAILQAIADKDGRSHVLYFVGPGGIGKTRLLEEIAIIRKEWTGVPFLWTGIIDLYHSSNHSPSRLRQTIIEGLDPHRQYFQVYRRLREEFEQKRRQGVEELRLERLASQIDSAFQQGYAILATKQRLVLCFDTLELIQYESDIIQEISQNQEATTAIKNWLIGHISRFPNTVTILAGRPRSMVQLDFELGLSESKSVFRSFDIQAFTKKEVFAYLDTVSKRYEELQEALSPEIRRQIVQITGGRPIYLALLIDLILQKRPLNEVFPVSDRAPDGHGVGKLLVEHLLDLPSPYGQMTYFLIHARKGLDADLLSYLIGQRPHPYLKLESIGRLWSAAEIEQNLDLMRKFAFVKTRPDTAQLFLHDEVYDLFDRYFQDTPRYRGPYESIAQYYREKLDAGVAPNREELMIALLYYELQIDIRSGYYQRYVPWTEEAIKSHEIGLDMRLRDEVLRFLDRYTVHGSPFYSRRIAGRVDRDAIDRDFAVRWIRRHTARARYQSAIEVAETILDLGPDLSVGRGGRFSQAAKLLPAIQEQARQLFGADDPLFWGHLLTYYGEALAYTGASEQQGVPVLKKAVELLDDGQSAKAMGGTPDNRQGATESFTPDRGRLAENDILLWLRTRVLGRAHNNLGHFAWEHQHFERAIEHYKTAINFYRRLSIRDEISDSMNNLAYVYALRGEISWAEKLADDALELRRRLGQKHPLALSLNTRGLIHDFAYQPHRARPRCREALAIFEELQDWRGIGLACIALGYTLRLIANQWQSEVYSSSEAETMYGEAQALLIRAIDVITEERGQLVEAYNDRGAVHRDWAIMEQELGQREADRGYVERAQEHFARARERFTLAEADFQRSLEQAGQDSHQVERADSLEDIADIFFRQSQYLDGEEQQQMLEQARRYLDEAEQLIPFEYHLVLHQGFVHIEDPVEPMWQMLGKLHLARGHHELVPFSRHTEMTDEHLEALLAAAEHYALAMIYLLKFAPNPDAHRNATDAIYRRLKVYSLPRLERVRQRVEKVAGEYRADVSPLLRMIDDVLGLKSQLS